MYQGGGASTCIRCTAAQDEFSTLYWEQVYINCQDVFPNWKWQIINIIIIIILVIPMWDIRLHKITTVEPPVSGHPWDQKKVSA